MGEYLSPGVYVEEVSSGSKPIAGVGTSTGAFVGVAEKGPIGEAKLITNWTQFINTFGNFINNGFLAYGVYHFFNEGGTKCYVTRTVHYSDITKRTSKTSVASTANLLDADSTPTISITASSDGSWGSNIAVSAAPATDVKDGFKLTVKSKNAKGGYDEVESLDDLTLENVESTVKKDSQYIIAEPLREGDGSFSGKIPDTSEEGPNQDKALTGGNDGLTDIGGTDYIGDAAAMNGIHAFDIVDEINIVAIPDAMGDISVVKSSYTYCERRKDCFFVADSPQNKTPSEMLDLKKKNYKSSFGALYYPWIEVSDPIGGKDAKKMIPPSGAVAGSISNSDVTRGVHKAPAGTAEGYLNGALEVERKLTKGEHDVLNNPGINVIRFFPGAGICIWGARTLSDDAEWKYINVRRLFLFVEESIDEGTQWVVFEPNSPALWGKVRRNITAFLTRTWRDGALFGNTPDEAFFVKVDAENNPPSVREAGQLIIEIGIAPVKPAEFVIIRISQKTLSA